MRSALAHPPRAIGLSAGNAASDLGAAMDIDLLRIIGAAIAGAVAIIVADFQVTVDVAPRAAPIIAGVRTAGFKAAVIGIDFVAAVLAIQAVVADASANDATQDCPHSRSGAARASSVTSMSSTRFVLFASYTFEETKAVPREDHCCAGVEDASN